MMFKRVVFLLSLGIVGWKVYELTWPLIDNHGIVEEGSYRGLKIGETRAEVITRLHDRTTRLKFHAYYIDKEVYFLPPWKEDWESLPPLSESEKWAVSYASFLGEHVVLTFTDDRLRVIEYARGLETP